MIVLNNVSKKIKNNIILKDINFKINKGKVYGIKGPNGSGKTMLLKVILGLAKSKGEIWIKEDKLKFGDKYPLNAGIFIEGPSIIKEFSALKNMQLISLIQHEGTNEEIHSLLDTFNLNIKNNSPVKNYSLGMKQKLGLAQAFLGHHELIVLDEPTNALDEESIENLKFLIRKKSEDGTTILITSHQLDILEDITDYLYYMEDGSLYESK